MAQNGPERTSDNQSKRYFSGWVTLIYAVLAALWILLSDIALELVVPDESGLEGVGQTIKGLLFVTVTSVSLYLLLRHLNGRAKQIIESRKAVEGRMRDFARSASDWFWEMGPDLRFTHLSERFRDIRADDPEYFVGKSRFELVASEQDTEFEREHRRTLEERKPFRDVVYPSRASTGEVWYARISGVPVFDENSVFRGYRGVGTDVTAELKDKERLESLAAIVESMPDFVGSLDHEGRFHFINPAGLSLLGHAPEMHSPAISLNNIHPPEATRTVLQQAMPMAVQKSFWQGENVAVDVAGNEIPVWQYLVAHPRKAGSGHYYSTIMHDLRVERDAATALRASEEKYRAIFESSGDGLIIFDEHGRVLEINPAACAMHGYSREEALGTDGRGFIDPDYHEVFADLVEGLKTQAGFAMETRHRRRDGTIFPAEVRGTMFTSDGLRLCLVVVRDISERARAEERLRQAQKMEAVGQLTGGIAHDFNNLLVVIMGYAERLADTDGSDEEIRKMAAAILRTSERAADLTHRLLAFARRQPLAPEAVELGDLIADMLPLLRRTLGENVHIEVANDSKPWLVNLDMSEFETCLLNLALNASDAMPSGGNITITLSNIDIDATDRRAFRDVAPGEYVQLSVTDEGIGMAEDVLHRALEPFFTTKEEGKGTGLGLSMCFGFAKQSGGHLAIYSEEALGTTVRLYLPRYEGKQAAPKTQREPAKLPRGDETVLVVEDNPEVRTFVIEQLMGLGYDVVSAETGPEAVELLKRNGDVDMVFTDVVMPGGMSGTDVVREARALKPGIAVLLTTGYADFAKGGRTPPDENQVLLTKPYRRDELARTVRKVLDERKMT